jgi:hypothetical protein
MTIYWKFGLSSWFGLAMAGFGKNGWDFDWKENTNSFWSLNQKNWVRLQFLLNNIGYNKKLKLNFPFRNIKKKVIKKLSLVHTQKIG